MYVLGIETSCDETSAAILKNGKLLSNIIFSQIDIHKVFGGVVPEIAAREHLIKLPAVVDEALAKAKIKMNDLDSIAVTSGPGLAGSLIVGLSYAKALAYALGINFIGVNHLESHLLSPFLDYEDFDFPFIGVVVSGGHTNIYIAKGFGNYDLIGSTRDDAAGEAFDKVAKMLGLPYPGGPSISNAALKGKAEKIIFPQAFMKDKSFDFSFSGIKTSVLYYIDKNKGKIKKGEITIDDIAAAFQKAVIRTLVNKIKRLYKIHRIKRIAITGGVAANKYLKDEIMNFTKDKDVKAYIPAALLCTDNAGMVAYAGYLYLKAKKKSNFDLEADPNLKI